MSRLTSVFVFFVALTLFSVLGPNVDAFEAYHDPSQNGTGYCASPGCHTTFPNRGDLHDLHVSPVTGNCDLCHTGSGRNNPLTMWSIFNSPDNPDGKGCAGCHGRDYGETIESDYNNGSDIFVISGLPKASGYGLRRVHQRAGVTECIDCHGDMEPLPESTQPPYYADPDSGSNITDPCMDNLDNDGDGSLDLDDSDCQTTNLCGNGTLDPGEQCDDGNTTGGDCCDANCQFESAGSTCGDPAVTECDSADTCDGAGTCEPNYAPPGAACGDQGIECLADDTCDGNGVCTDNGPEPDGTACGDPSDTQCDNPDSCLAGLCESNHEPPATVCDDGEFCTVGDACDGTGVCAGGPDSPCQPGETCDETSDICVPPAEADVSLERLRAPKNLKLGTAMVSKRITAVDDADTKAQDATVTISSVMIPEGLVTITVTPSSDTQQVDPGNGGTQFKFNADIACNSPDTSGTIMWTATITAPENRDGTNDTATATTNVTCR